MEQIIPYFSPAMNLNLKLQPTGEPESIPIILNSVTVDTPTDIPENDERIFTITYSFTMKLNYYTPKKNQYLINKVTDRLITQTEIFEIDQAYIENLNTVTTTFSQYMNNTGLSNPFLGQ